MPKIHGTKPEELLKMTPAAIRMRVKRAALRAQNEQEFLVAQALAGKKYILKVKEDSVESVDPLADTTDSVLENLESDNEVNISAEHSAPLTPVSPKDDSPVILSKSQKKNIKHKEVIKQLKASIDLLSKSSQQLS